MSRNTSKGNLRPRDGLQEDCILSHAVGLQTAEFSLNERREATVRSIALIVCGEQAGRDVAALWPDLNQEGA